MLPLWRDELRVVLAPEQVALVRIGRTLTKRGPVARIEAKNISDCVPANGDEAPWDAAIKALERELPQFLARKTVAKVVLSNHFMRYTMMPWSDTLSDAAEEVAYARHCFRQIYGEAAEQWELRLSLEHDGLPQMASAVDMRLLASLRAVFERNNVALGSIQPRLMAAYNNCRTTLHTPSAWFALYEPGCLCLGLLHDGRWASVRTMRIGSDWRDNFSLLLEREAYMTEPGATTDAVFLWAPELDEIVLPQSERWKIHNLRPAVPPAFIPEYEGRFAMALSV